MNLALLASQVSGISNKLNEFLNEKTSKMYTNLTENFAEVLHLKVLWQMLSKIEDSQK